LRASTVVAALASGTGAHARGGHHFGADRDPSNARFARSPHANDAHVKAASVERDNLLKKLMSICTGCWLRPEQVRVGLMAIAAGGARPGRAAIPEPSA
jgi:hypothetical protein